MAILEDMDSRGDFGYFLKSLVVRIFLLSSAVSALAACSFENRYGPRPIIDATAVELASTNTNAIIAALARDSGVYPGATPDYYLVALAGFNYVDDQCRAYFDQLFFLNRGREQAKSGLAAASQTTAAILGVTGASATSLAVVAQAFGFSINATELVAGTYLYGLPPAATQGFVQKLQLAYRDGAFLRREAINSAPAAYYAIQRYLDLCLPPRIEAEITKQISSANAVPIPQADGALFSLATFGAAPPPRPLPPAAFEGERARPFRSSVIDRSSDRMERREPLRTVSPTRLTDREQTIREATIKGWQAALCLKSVTGDLGPRGSLTRLAIQDYLVGRGLQPTQEVDPVVFVYLEKAREAVPGTCEEAGFKNAKEVGRSLNKNGR